MRRYLLALFLGLALIGCSKDDEDKEAALRAFTVKDGKITVEGKIRAKSRVTAAQAKAAVKSALHTLKRD